MSKARRWVLVGLGVGNVLILGVLIALWIATIQPDEMQSPLELTEPSLDGAPVLEMSTQSPVPTVTSLTASPISQAVTPNRLVISPEDAIISQTAACPISVTGGLASEIYALVQVMPGPGSEGMVVPTEAQMAAWEALVLAMSAGDAQTACVLIAENHFPYELVSFTDVRAGNNRYWLLRELIPVTVGWGTVVIRASEAVTDVVVEVPHPLADWRTDPEGVALFRGLQAKALLVAGTHRCANAAYSACAGSTMACGALEPYRTSDVGHATQTMFQTAHQALAPCGSATVAIQLHANSLAPCPDLFVSNGTLYPAGAVTTLADALAASCPDYSVDLADGKADDAAGECGFYGGAAVQGVYANGCELGQGFDACDGIVSQPFGLERFIHLEQSTAAREDYTCVVAAFRSWWSQRKP